MMMTMMQIMMMMMMTMMQIMMMEGAGYVVACHR